MKLVIDGFINLKGKVVTRIPKGSPVFLIFFLIYISEKSLEIEKQLPQITSLSFIDDLRFLVLIIPYQRLKNHLKNHQKN